MSDKRSERLPFESAFFYGELNRFVGSGGEVLVKPDGYAGDGATRMDVGDRLIGIGVAHIVESMSRPPGPEAFRAVNAAGDYQMKVAERALRVTEKRETEVGFEFGFEPLEPSDFSALLSSVSNGGVEIPADSIPRGTFVLSILHNDVGYSLADAGDSAANWVAAAAGHRHWNVGVGSADDFWWARLPSDDIGLLRDLPPYERVGEIRFGLSMLDASRQVVELEPVEFRHPSGRTTRHDFCLSGAVTGVAGLATPFPIGLRTEILFKPRSASNVN